MMPGIPFYKLTRRAADTPPTAPTSTSSVRHNSYTIGSMYAPRVLRHVIAVGVVALLLGSASASSSGSLTPQEPAAPEGITEVVFLATSITLNKGDPREAWKLYFEKAHPGLSLRYTSASTNTDASRSRITELIKGTGSDHRNDVPDVFLGDVNWPAQFGQEGTALALDGLFSPDFWNRLDKDMVAAAKYDGKIYAVPFYREQGILFYRQDLLEKIDARVPRTWEELADVSLRLVAASAVKYGFVWQGASYEGLTCNWLEFATDAGAQLIDKDRARSQVNSPQALQALRFMRSLITRGISPREVTQFQEGDAMRLFNSGEAAFLRAWNSQYTGISAPDGTLQASGFPVGVAELPTFAGQPEPGSSTVGGWNLFVNPKISKDPRKMKAVATFIEWMTDVPGQHILAQYGQIPANTTVLNMDPLFTSNPVLSTTERVKQVRRPHELPTYPALSGAVQTEIHRALTGEISPEAALRNAEERINAVLK